MTTMHEMESVVTEEIGNIVAVCKAGRLGLTLGKTKTSAGVLRIGRLLKADDTDCEYRILQVRNARLSNKSWQSKAPVPLGFLPPDDVKVLLAGGTVTRGCR